MIQPFADQYGTELSVDGETSLPGCARIRVSAKCGAHIPAETFPRLIAALYETAGRPAPVILKRPGRHAADSPVRIGDIVVGRLHDRVTVGLYGIQPENLPPAIAREVAAHIAGCADDIEVYEPDPDDVEELTAFFAAETARCDRTGELDRTRARAALKWMRQRERRPS